MTRVAIIGGGLAGLAAAVQLAERAPPGWQVELFESRRRLGGRAGSYLDPAAGEWIDHCQHVGMGCCGRLLELARRTHTSDFFRRDTTLFFYGPDGRRSRFAADRWLPAPLHLARAFARLGYLSWGERWRIARTLRRLAQLPDSPAVDAQPLLPWLVAQGQSAAALERFWSLVIVSAASETLDRCSLAVARKIFVDGFLATRDGYHVLVPTRPLVEWAEALAAWAESHGVRIHRGVAVESIQRCAPSSFQLRYAGVIPEDSAASDAVLLATPWRQAASIVANELRRDLPELEAAKAFPSAAIRSLHLWWERPFFDAPHAVLVGRLSQWVFRHPAVESGEFYTQVVISAAHAEQLVDPAKICDEVVRELREVWPAACDVRLLRWRLLTQPHAVFSPRPGLAALRPAQRTAVCGFYLAGDWTRTGWPATMEGAIRSGEQAAAALLEDVHP
ncbi:MAG: hydroxysqualene dehydroxylase HpnE [Pirellulales bacterium]